MDYDPLLPLRQSHHIVHYGPAGRVAGLSSGLEEPGVDPLGDDDVGELQLSLVQPGFLKTFLREGD